MRHGYLITCTDLVTPDNGHGNGSLRRRITFTFNVNANVVKLQCKGWSGIPRIVF